MQRGRAPRGGAIFSEREKMLNYCRTLVLLCHPVKWLVICWDIRTESINCLCSKTNKINNLSILLTHQIPSLKCFLSLFFKFKGGAKYMSCQKFEHGLSKKNTIDSFISFGNDHYLQIVFYVANFFSRIFTNLYSNV